MNINTFNSCFCKFSFVNVCTNYVVYYETGTDLHLRETPIPPHTYLKPFSMQVK